MIFPANLLASNDKRKSKYTKGAYANTKNTRKHNLV